jgi:hypothetical protein
MSASSLAVVLNALRIGRGSQIGEVNKTSMASETAVRRGAVA